MIGQDVFGFFFCGNKIECGGNGGAPPASLAEITLNGWGNIDYYDISLVDGFNLAVSVSKLGGSKQYLQQNILSDKGTTRI